MSHPDADPDLSPTRARFVVAAWLCGLSGILYLDRICMGQAVVPIQAELGLSNTEMSYVLMSFTLAYGLFAVPAGSWGDKRGPRSVLAQIVLAWSMFTALTGAATGLLTLLLVRFLFGAAEAGAFPNAAKVMARWFPPTERGRVQGVMLAFSQFGAVLAPAATAYLIEHRGLADRISCVRADRRRVGGRVLVVVPRRPGTTLPREPRGTRPHPSRRRHKRKQTATPGPVPWGDVVTNRGIIVLSVIMVFGAFYTYFFYSWFQKYLNASRGVENVEAGNLTSLVMAGSAVGMLFGGWLADRISKMREPGSRPSLPRRGLLPHGGGVPVPRRAAGRRAVARDTLGGVVLRHAHHATELVVVRDPARRTPHRNTLRADERPRRVRGDGIAGVRRLVRRPARKSVRADRARRVGPGVRRVRRRADRGRGRVVAIPLHAAAGTTARRVKR